MKSAITRVMVLAAGASCVAFAPAASAEPAVETAPSGVPAQATPVDVVLVGRAASEGSLAERIRSWFGPGATVSITKEDKLVAERVLGPLPVRRVAVWVTERTRSEARLYFVAGETQSAMRYLIRDVPLDRGFDEVGSERVAQVVHSSVTALIEGSIEAAERPEVERLLATPAKPSEPSPRKPEETRVRPRQTPASASQESPGPSFDPLAGVFYRGALSGDEGFAHGPGLALGGTVRFARFGVGAVARGEYVLPHSERFEVLDVTLSGLMARLGARGEWIEAPVHVDVELGAGFVWMRYDPETPATPSGPLPGARDVDPRFFAFSSFGASHAIGAVRVGIRLELEAYPIRSHYDLDSGREIGSAARFQPSLALEATFD